MDFSYSPLRIQNDNGRWFDVVSSLEGGFLVRDTVTSDLVYLKQSDILRDEDDQSAH